MRKHRLAIAGVTLMALSLTATACGTRSDEGGSGGSGGESTKTATIGVISPLTGDLAAMGIGIKNSVDLAVKQANENNTRPGWTLKVRGEDDEAKADTGRNAATNLTSDDSVVGVVGPLNSNVGQTVQPVLNSAKIAEVSPANTGVSLTKGGDADHPKRVYDNYFRTCTTDDIQGPFAARYMYQTAGIKKVGTIHDKKAYGQGLVTAFTAEFKKLGGEVVSAQTINPDDSNFGPVISKVKSAGPRGV